MVGGAQKARGRPVAAKADGAIGFILNGKEVQTKADPQTPLAQVLREGFGLTGTKTFCESGVCGACTVHVNGQTTNSCTTPLYKVSRQRVKTIENLGAAKLHEVQEAFIAHDALQCGFCTPGMVMAAAAFVDAFKEKTPNEVPQKNEIHLAMAGNLCRCGAQPQIIAAIQSCFGPNPKPPQKGVFRHDAREKVTGDAQYAFDYYPNGILHAAVLRATHASAQVKKINIKKAKGMPGVHAIVIHLPKVKKGFGKIRWAGQEIAAVAAETLAQAKAAVAAIELDWVKSEPAIFPKAAKATLAPKVWNKNERGDAPAAQEAPGMPACLFEWEGNTRGPGIFDSDDDLKEAKAAVKNDPLQILFEGETASQSHVPLECHGCVVEIKGKDLIMVATTQTVKNLASDLADAFDWDEDHVKVVAPFVGGGFGAKASFRPEHIMAVNLALKAKRPVRLFYEPGAHILLGGNRPGTRHTIHIGADKEGQIKKVVHHNESYCGAAVGETASRLTQAHYPKAEIHTVDQNVVTHTPALLCFSCAGASAQCLCFGTSGR